MSQNDIDNHFRYHAPNDSQIVRYGALREQARQLAQSINEQCPDSVEKRTALGKLREVVMWANASIACNEAENVVVISPEDAETFMRIYKDDSPFKEAVREAWDDAKRRSQQVLDQDQDQA